MLSVQSRAKLRQAISYFWRFKTLKTAKAAFWGTSSAVLERPFSGYRLSLDVSRTYAQRLLYLEGERFVKERKLIERLTEPGMIVVDVGANIGYYMLLFANFIGEKGKIICFEPEPDNLRE